MSTDSRVGTELAGYRIQSLLGWGGMSVVYLAEDARLKRNVALKLMASGLTEDESFRERFLRESELAASIDHPNIVPIYEAGTTDDVLFIAMRYVEGRDLRARLELGRLEPAAATGLLAQLASALDAAHARGLVHRDVKPSNVLLDPGARPDGSDHVYLADFGLTRQVSEKTNGREDGSLLGTIDYVAPEQIAGEELDGRADVYSLGCLLYECLVGEPPFRRDSELAVVFAHLDAEPPAPSAKRPELPDALDAVIAQALAKEAGQRYATCRELARAALAVTVDEAGRQLADAASRAAAGRSVLSDAEADLANKVIDLQLAREQARAISAAPTPARLATRGVCPFKGLASFEPADAEYFFGRERLIAELVARLVGGTFLGIVGPSGSGKSSVLRAGLLPALAGGVLPGSERWRRVLIRPGERPLEELRRMLASGAEDPLAEALDALVANERILLAVDQLEELFTACASEEERATFAEAIGRAATDPQGRAIVAVALRADFYGRFASYPALAELLGANHVLVGPMQGSELRRAIELPAARVGLDVEPALGDALVDDVEGEPGALPLLSTALLELWQKRHGDRLTLAAYRESGGVHGSVARLAESTYDRIPDGRKPLVRAIMLRLVGEGEADAAVRRRAPLAELDLERNPDVADVLTILADSRLVSVGEGSVEVAHEALLREWPRLREWILEDSEGRRLRRHITRAATDWDAAGRDTGELYRGARLAAALDWSAEHAFELNEVERAFVTESREASETETKRVRRTNRRLRVLLAGVAVLLAAAVAGAGYALVQRGQARDAAAAARQAETAQVAQRLAAQALVEEDTGLSLLLARQAIAIDDTAQTRSYLFTALLRAPTAIAIMHGSDDATFSSIALSPDGTTLAVTDFFNGLRFFDAETFEQIGKLLPSKDWVNGVAYSPDGRTLAMSGFLGNVRLIDARTRKTLTRGNFVGSVRRLSLTRDGSRIVVVTNDPLSIRVLDAATLKPLGIALTPGGVAATSPRGYGEPPQVALTPDSRSLLIASDEGALTWRDLGSGRTTRTIRIPAGRHALALSPDGAVVAVGIDRGLQLIDARTGTRRTATSGMTGAPSSLLFSPDGETVASTNPDATVALWDVRSARIRTTLRGQSSVVQPVFSHDGRTLYTASDDGTAIAWDLTGKRGIRRTFRFTGEGPFDPTYDGHPGRISPDGRLIAVGLKGRGIALLDATTLTRSGPPLLATAGEVKALAFSPDGRTLGAITPGGEATIWDVASRSLRTEPLPPAGGNQVGIAFTPDGKTLVTGGVAGVQLWDVATGGRRGDIGGENSFASDVALSADGARVALAQRQAGAGAEVWDVASRSRLASFESGAGATELTVAFSPDGRLLATAGFGRFARLWDVASRKLVRKLDLGGGGSPSLEFSPDGATLAVSRLGEPVAFLWDVATGTRIGPTLTAGRRTAMLDVSDDGRQLLLTLANGEGAIWDIDPKSWARRACALANRTLSREEWARFLPNRPYAPACT